MLIVIASFALISLIDMPHIIKRKERRDTVLYIAVFAAALVFCALYALDVRFKSPIEAIYSFFENALGLSYAKFRH